LNTISLSRRVRARAPIALVAAALVAATVAGTAGTATAASGDRSRLRSVGTLSGTTLTAVLNLTGTAPTSVMVKLDYDALSTYSGDIPNLAATSPQVTGRKLDVASPQAVAYSRHIDSVEQGFVSALHQTIPSAKVERTYHTVYGGVAVQVPANQAASLLNLPSAVAVQADSLHHLDQATPAAEDDSEFIGGNTAYAALGSSATAGQGVIVANVDTGIWPEHPSFAARPDLPATPPPTPDGHPRECNFGTNPLTGTPFACNNKLIGGQVFLSTYNSLVHDELYPTTARDSDGHGTHTLSTAAGNPLAQAQLFGVDRGPVQGIAVPMSSTTPSVPGRRRARTPHRTTWPSWTPSTPGSLPAPRRATAGRGPARSRTPGRGRRRWVPARCSGRSCRPPPSPRPARAGRS